MKPWILCKHCIDAIKSRGEKIYVGSLVERDIEMIGKDRCISDGMKCEWCDEEDDELYECLQ